MNFKDFYFEIGEIQKRFESKESDQLFRELQFFVQYHQWRSPLIYGSLYISRVGTSSVLAFFARKTLEEIERVCEQRIYRDNKTLKMEQAEVEKDESLLSKKQLDQLLISITLLIFTFDLPEQRGAIDSVEKVIQKKLRNNKYRFIDKLPLNDYLNLLGYKFLQNKEEFKPLSAFFYELIKNSGLGEAMSFERQATKVKKNIEILIEEAGGMIEKPDRIFSYADSMDPVTHFAESLFDSDNIKEKVPFNKYKWDFIRTKSLDDLSAFWVTCMTGLFVFAQSVDQFIALSGTSEKVQTDTVSIKTPGREEHIVKEEEISQENVKKPKKSLFISKKFKRKPILKLAFAFK